MFLGYQENLPINGGDIIIIPKGVKVKTMHPSKDSYITKRKQKIEVNHTLPGQSLADGTPRINPSVRWAGTGGYWCEVDINDVIKE